MKDYSLVKYYAKVGKSYVKIKNAINTSFPFGKSGVRVTVVFNNNKTSLANFYFLDLIYKDYAYKLYPSLNAFVLAFAKQYNYYEVAYKNEKDKDSVYLICNYYKTASKDDDYYGSRALLDMSMFSVNLNKFLGLNVENYLCAVNLKSYQLAHLNHKKKKMKLLLIGGVIGFIFGIILRSSNPSGGFDAVLGLLLLIFAPVAAVVSIIKSKIYKSKMKEVANK